MKKSCTIEDLLSVLTEEMPAEDILSADISSRISAAITKHRTAKGLSQSELAEKIGMSQSTISKWENGDMNFTIDTLSSIAVKLQMELTVELKDPPTIEGANGYRVIRSKVISFPFKSASFCSSNYRELKEM